MSARNGNAERVLEVIRLATFARDQALEEAAAIVEPTSPALAAQIRARKTSQPKENLA